MRNQPADAWQVIRQIIRLDARRDDPLAGHIATDRLAAAGHSAGGYTTAGLFTNGHSSSLRAGIIIAGGGMPGGPSGFTGPRAALLFIHGGSDATVPSPPAGPRSTEPPGRRPSSPWPARAMAAT